MILDKFFTPLKSTIEALEKSGYPLEQQRKIWKVWVDNHSGEEYEDLNRKYREVVRKEPAHNIKPDRSEDKAQAEARKEAFNNKSKDSKERIINIKDRVQYQVGEAQLKRNLAMIQYRFKWTSEQCDEWLERELEKDSKRKAR